MSVVFITQHNENIYHLDMSKETASKSTTDQTVHHYRIGKYKTKYHQMKRPNIKQQHATMGIAEIGPPLPSEYLRKHTGQVSYSKKSEPVEKSKIERHVVSVPTREEIAELNKKREELRRQQMSRNHVVENIKNVKGMKAGPKQQNYIVIDPYGTKARIIESLVSKSKVFGKTPKYLKQFYKHQQKLIDEMKKTKEKEEIEQTKCKQITPEEREKILQGLKHNWAELQKEFQSLPILTDTIPKVIRKVRLERELKQLEKDIDLIENHPYIYIYEEQ